MDRKYIIGGFVGCLVGAAAMTMLAVSPISPFRPSYSQVYTSPDKPSVLVLRKIGPDQMMVEDGPSVFVDRRIYTSPSWVPDSVKREKKEKEIEAMVPKRNGMLYEGILRILSGAKLIKS